MTRLLAINSAARLARHRPSLLTKIQPALAGLRTRAMSGISLAPRARRALATHSLYMTLKCNLVALLKLPGCAAFAEVLHTDLTALSAGYAIVSPFMLAFHAPASAACPPAPPLLCAILSWHVEGTFHPPVREGAQHRRLRCTRLYVKGHTRGPRGPSLIQREDGLTHRVTFPFCATATKLHNGPFGLSANATGREGGGRKGGVGREGEKEAVGRRKKRRRWDGVLRMPRAGEDSSGDRTEISICQCY